jgi:hypothetical protein
MKVVIFEYELSINFRKVPQSRRIVCSDCGKNTITWYEIDVCEPCHNIQQAIDEAESRMANWANSDYRGEANR